jgi:hypothetical protein
VTEGRFAQDQEQQQGDGPQQEVRTQPAAAEGGREKPEDEADGRHEEGRNATDVHELVLQMMAREELAQSAFKGLAASPRGASRARRRTPGRAGTGDRIGLGLPAKPAEASVGLDWLAALATERGIASGRPRTRQSRPIIRLQLPVEGVRQGA